MQTGGAAAALELEIEEAEVEAGIVRDERRILDEVEQLLGLLREARLVRQEDRCEAVDRFGLARHVALGIEISVEVPAGLDAVEHLDAADLDHAVAAGRVEPGGFGVENDFPHGRIYPPGGESETSENIPDLALQLWIGRRRCR